MLKGKPSKKWKVWIFSTWGGGSGPNPHFYKSVEKGFFLALFKFFACFWPQNFWKFSTLWWRGGLGGVEKIHTFYLFLLKASLMDLNSKSYPFDGFVSKRFIQIFLYYEIYWNINNWPNFVKFWQLLTNIEQLLTKFWTILRNIWPILFWLTLDPLMTNFLPAFDQLLINFSHMKA